MYDVESVLHEIIDAAIDSVKPDTLVNSFLNISDNTLEVKSHKLNLESYNNIYIAGAGKASAYLAKEIETLLGDRITGGIVSVKYGHSTNCSSIKIIEAGHPVLDQNSLRAAREILELVENTNENDLVICLLSGGGSALMEKLPDGISLNDFQKLNDILLSCGAEIEEINTLRKHISLIKGGQLARTIYPAECLTLIISDVIGDPVEAIASGPTAPDSKTFDDVFKVIEKYNLVREIPPAVLKYFEAGKNSIVPETLKPGDKIFGKVNNVILGNNLSALKNAEEAAIRNGYNSKIIDDRLNGEAKFAAKKIADLTKKIISNNEPVSRPVCLLYGGETTVKIKGSGKGGRNQELVLAALIEMKDITDKFIIASVGTDGTDGPTDAAGGFIDQDSIFAAREKNLDPETFLLNNDSYNFLKEINGLIKTGPTGTNVMDLIVVLIP